MLNAPYPRLEYFGDLKAREYIQETIVKNIAAIDRVEAGHSARKAAAGKLTAIAQSGRLPADEVMKGSLASYAFERNASYRILIAAGQYVEIRRQRRFAGVSSMRN